MAVTLWSAWAAGLALLAAPAGGLLAQEKPAESCALEGTARNSVTRIGLAKAAISLIPLNGTAAYSGASNSAGVFHFEGVAPGDYRLEAQRPGYSAGVLSDKSGHAIATLHLTAGHTSGDNDLWFAPDSSLAGRVYGPDGEPLPDADITVITQQWRNGKRLYVGARSGHTDDAGVYRCEGLAPGRYFVHAGPPHTGPLAFSLWDTAGAPETRIAGRYHPNAPAIEGASMILLQPGEEVAGIDFRLPLARVFHLSGSTSAPSPDGGSVTVKRRFNDQMLDWEQEVAPVNSDGTFDIAGVKAGNYFLYASQFAQRNSLTSGRVPVTIADQDSTGVVAPAVSRFELKGRVRIDGVTPDAIPVQIFCEGSEADDFTSYQRRAQPQADGAFAVHDLTPDRYSIRIANLETGKEGGYYLKEVRVNGVAVPGGEIDLTKGPAESVELVLSAGVGGAEGTVRWPAAAPDSAAMPEPAGELTVLLIPERTASGDVRAATTYLDQDGRFRLNDLEPGSYRAFAVTNYDKGLWQNSEFRRLMAPRGAPLEITEKASVRVEAPVLTAAEIRSVEERIQ